MQDAVRSQLYVPCVACERLYDVSQSRTSAPGGPWRPIALDQFRAAGYCVSKFIALHENVAVLMCNKCHLKANNRDASNKEIKGPHMHEALRALRLRINLTRAGHTDGRRRG